MLSATGFGLDGFVILTARAWQELPWLRHSEKKRRPTADGSMPMRFSFTELVSAVIFIFLELRNNAEDHSAGN